MNDSPQVRYRRKLRLKVGEVHGNKVGSRKEWALRTLSEVALILGCSRQAVQQLERRAFWKIRVALRKYLTR